MKLFCNHNYTLDCIISVESGVELLEKVGATSIPKMSGINPLYKESKAIYKCTKCSKLCVIKATNQ